MVTRKFYLKLLMSLLLVALAVPQGKAETKLVADGTETNEYVPVHSGYMDAVGSTYQVIYPASALEDLVGCNITGIKFYASKTIDFSQGSLQVSIGETSNVSFNSATPLTGLDVAVTTAANPSGKEFGLNFTNEYPYNGGNLVIEIKVLSKLSFSGFGHIPWYGVTSGVTNNAYCGDVGTGGTVGLQSFLPKTTFTYESAGPKPTLSADPTSLNFSTVAGTEVTKTVTVTSANLTGDITTTVSGTNASYFTVSPASLGTNGGELTVAYNPTAVGEHTATLTLSSAGAEDVVIALNGSATAPAQPYAVTVNPENGYDFGNVLVNSSNVWTLTITNNGTKVVTPTLSGIEVPFSTNYTPAALAAGESVTITFTFAPTEVNNYSNTVTISFPEAGDAIDAYTCELSGKAVDESYDPDAEKEVVKLVTVDKRSIYEPNFIDNANNSTTPQQLNCYDMRFKMAQHDDPAKRIKARDLRPGNNLFEFYAIDDFGTEFRFATINLFAEGQPSSNPSVSAMDAPIVVTPSVEYYTEDGMPVHPTYTHNTNLNYTEKTYNDINELVDLEGVIDYVNDTWSANTATNAHPDHYKFQIRGVGQFGEKVTELTAEYVKSHIGDYGLIDPEGWYRSMVVAPNNEYDDEGNYVDTYYFYDLYISNEFLQSKGITGPVTVVINTTLSKSGYNADEFKTISVNGVDQIIAKEKFKDYSWTVPLVDEMHEGKSMGIVIRSETRPGSDFNKTRSIYIYGGGTGVSNVDTVGIYKSSMNVKAYTQKQVDEDTDRGLVAMNSNNGVKADVNVLAYADPAVTGYKLYENSTASTAGITPNNHVASANHVINNEEHKYIVNSTGTYNGSYNFVRDESLGNIDGMWLPMYPADAQMYYMPVTYANGVGDDGVVRSEGNTYGSAMQQVEKNGSVAFNKDNSQCIRSEYTWVKDGVRYAIYNPDVFLTSELPAATGYELYNYRLWVDYEDNAPAWDFEVGEDGKIHLTNKMDRPLYEGTATHIGRAGAQGRRDEWSFVAPSNLEQIKLVARFYYKKNSAGKARPTDSDRLYYVVENQITLKVDDEGIVTGIDNVTSKAVANVKYYNMAGIESDVPFQGINIEVTTYTDGSRTTRKIMK